ncbi:division/cell wall cluster transcriptional repressor MraZ [Agrilactobacillus fermenti]|uniref:division/cell wall cluster transcriptional repressor MraZ n=1 Tax=Agrilactobacillus fermenti TaxID=2586909 RepID=UPI001E59861C|nr:division/cell wall cluster transcriptional repressor MraZ [Agrilactobacillus fermenti]MCD2255318.1 division/cell wall cluster transcriptional repressor MraZ [Agrilactobacillus fermenti]
MLLGEYQHNLDAKGRLIIPAKFRKDLGQEFILTRGLDGCIFGYPLSEWQKLEAKLTQLPLNKKDARTFVRFFYSAATEATFDKQGRINLPQTLITHAKLEKSCVLVGVSNRIEIWNAVQWQQVDQQMSENFDDISENLIDFDL